MSVLPNNTTDAASVETNTSAVTLEAHVQNPYIMTALLLSGVLIIVLNSWTLVCLKTHRQLISPSSLWVHLVTLSINDLFSGFSTAFLAASGYSFYKPRSYCFIVMMTYITCQVVSHLNILCICIVRFRHIMHVNCAHRPSENRYLLMLVLAPWVFGVILVSLGAVLIFGYSDTESDISCHLINKNKIRHYVVSILLLVITVELLLLHSIYAVCALKTQFVLSKMQTPLASQKLGKRLLVIIGRVLILFDISTFPTVTVIALMVLVPHIDIPRQFISTSFAMLSLNSLLNPIIYSFSFEGFRTASMENLKKIKSVFCS